MSFQDMYSFLNANPCTWTADQWSRYRDLLIVKNLLEGMDESSSAPILSFQDTFSGTDTSNLTD